MTLHLNFYDHNHAIVISTIELEMKFAEEYSKFFTEKAATRAFSLLKTPISAFTFKKLGPQCKSHKGWVAIRLC